MQQPGGIDMEKLIERIQTLLKEKHCTPNHMARDLGFSSGLFTQWRQGSQIPSSDKLYRIAVYLETSMDYLTGLEPHGETSDLRRTILQEMETISESGLERILDYVRFTAEQEKKRPTPAPLPPELS